MKAASCHPERANHCKNLCKSCYFKQWRTENKAYTVQKKKEYYQENKEKIKRQAKENYSVNRDRVKKAAKEWSKKHPEYANIKARRRRAALKGALIEKYVVTHEMLKQRALACGNVCFYCQNSEWRHWDHRIPLSRGGKEILANLVPSCVSCNSSKGAKSLKDWKRV